VANRLGDLRLKHGQKLRFAIVGGANTALDFVLLFALTALGLDKIPANYVSTSVALVFSFFVNKSFTFRSKDGNARKQFVLFLVITLFGLWVLQPLVILGIDQLFVGSAWSETVVLFVAKLLATIVSLVWNYLLYSKLVFKK